MYNILTGFGNLQRILAKLLNSMGELIISIDIGYPNCIT